MRAVLIESVKVKECLTDRDCIEIHKMNMPIPRFDEILVGNKYGHIEIERAFYRHFRKADGTQYKVAFTEEVNTLIGGYFSDYEEAYKTQQELTDSYGVQNEKLRARIYSFENSSLFSRIKSAFKGEIK